MYSHQQTSSPAVRTEDGVRSGGCPQGPADHELYDWRGATLGGLAEPGLAVVQAAQ